MDTFEITTVPNADDYDLILMAWNQGIDSRLEAFTESTHEWKDEFLGPRLYIYLALSELQILIRRLLEIDEWGAAGQLADDIVSIQYGHEVI